MFAAGVIMCSHLIVGCVTLMYPEPVKTLQECEQVIIDELLPRTERRVRLGAFPPDLFMESKLCEPYKPGKSV